MSASQNRLFLSVIVACILSCCCLLEITHAQSTQSAPSWNRFRGPNGTGVGADAKPPITFDRKTNLQWATPLPAGHSSPVIWSDRIFITGVREKTFETICVNRDRGKILWRKPGPEVQMESHSRLNSPATSTPFADADRVYVYFGSYGLLCYNHDGKELWKLPVRTPKNIHGTASSPIGYKHLLYLIHDSVDGDSYVLAVEKSNGREAWKARRACRNPNWSTPVIWHKHTGDELIVLGGGMVKAYEPLTGEERWSVGGFGHPIPQPVVSEKYLVVSTASGEEAGRSDKALRWEILSKKYDANSDGIVHVSEIPKTDFTTFNEELPDDRFPTRAIVAWFDRNHDNAFTEEEVRQFLAMQNLDVQSRIALIRPTTDVDTEDDRIAWDYKRSIPRNSSCLAVQGKIYMFNDGGIVTCLDSRSGRSQNQFRIARGHYWSSPIYANGHIYIGSSEGVVTVLRTGDRLETISVNDLGEPIVATPATSGDAIYVRTASQLYAFSKNDIR